MKTGVWRASALAVLFAAAIGVFSIPDVAAQQRRQSRRRATARGVETTATPTAQQPPRDAEVVGSTEDNSDVATDQQNGEMTATPAAEVPADGSATPAGVSGEAEALRVTIDRLNEQVRSLTRKLEQVERRNNRSADLEMERLTRAEQRAEQLHTQLQQLQDREINLRSRAEQLDLEMQPESLARRTELIGTVNPEALRQQYRQQFEREKLRVTAQLEQTIANRARLETAVANADAYADRLRQRVEGGDAAATTTTTTQPVGSSQPRTTRPESLP